MAKRKRVRMAVEVSCPSWLTAAEARKEVRSLVNGQCFYGHMNRKPDKSQYVSFEEIGGDNFRAVCVRPASKGDK